MWMVMRRLLKRLQWRGLTTSGVSREESQLCTVLQGCIPITDAVARYVRPPTATTTSNASGVSFDEVWEGQMTSGIEGCDAWRWTVDDRGRRALTYDASLADLCAIDGCREPLTILSRPDGRYRVTHGARADEGGVRFYSASELFNTDGYRAFAREIHATERGNR
jgi:hypothetical protein